MGHHDKVVIETDQEPTIIDIIQTVAKGRGESQTILETAARSDPKGDGGAERAVQSIESMVRTLMIDIEERCGGAPSVEEGFFDACDLIIRFKVRAGGKTAWESPG